MILIDEPVRMAFPSLRVIDIQVTGVKVAHYNPALEKEKAEVAAEVRSRHTLVGLKDEPLMRKYRDFFWKVDVDPTKTRPASEALIRRVLSGRPVPTINTLVDAYNIASIRSGVPIAAFDTDRLEGATRMRFARAGERFLGIGMEREAELRGVEVVLEDAGGLSAVYPYRDAERTKVTASTKNATLLICGVPGVDDATLDYAKKLGQETVVAFCGGRLVA
jgi:DNA/RNA-binding domain of Phe-tRNA-synthetase-like protein